MHRFVRIGLFLFAFALAPAASAQRTAAPKTGPNDTILVSAIFYDNEWIPYSFMEPVYVSNVSPEKMAKAIQEYNRLRNAVYVTYRYAQEAGAIINDVNTRLRGVDSKKERKKYIKSREDELKKKFSDPLSNLSVYQGKVLMKLINRETGNDCYEIIKEYRGGLNARMYQTVAFFFGSDLKQPYDAQNNAVDRQIEVFVQEIHNGWYGRR
ncbi:MAG TPA: DUF4294 domain-containing protein [Flavisolibacter sp.]|nr:DUF4294 domain-containing protein [Flavisolibacter sp.]